MKKHTFTAVIYQRRAARSWTFRSMWRKPWARRSPRSKPRLTEFRIAEFSSRMGLDHHILIILKNIREQIGKTFGDKVKITVELDTEPRVIEVPKDLAKELKKHKEAKAFFDKLSYTHKREYVMWINEAKKEETRQNRIVKTIEMLKKGKKQS
ncbi:MAG: YdeI/OmpD-associated family protein [Anaerolineales bacterium]